MIILFLFLYYFSSCASSESSHEVKKFFINNKIEAIQIIINNKLPFGHIPGGCINYFEKAELRAFDENGGVTITPLNYDFFSELGHSHYKKEKI